MKISEARVAVALKAYDRNLKSANASRMGAMRAALEAAVGEMVLVPREPTRAMLDAACEQHECEQMDPHYSNQQLSEGDARNIYTALLAAANGEGE